MNEENIIKKYEKDFIVKLDLNKIEWLKLNYQEMKRFLDDNYYDEKNNQYVTNDIFSPFKKPFGMKFLPLRTMPEDSYILGVIPNKIGKKTIVIALIYIDKYIYDHIPYTYLLTFEVNKYYQGLGLSKYFTDRLINFVNPNQDIIFTEETEMGALANLCKNGIEKLYINGFKQHIYLNKNNIKERTL